MAKKRILSIGKAAVRLDSVMARFPMKNEEVSSFSRLNLALEGGGLAGALSSAFLGAESLICSAAGDDLYGEKLGAILRSNGVDTRFLFSFKGDRTSLAMHFREKEGGVRRIYYEGAAEHLSEEEIEHAFLAFPDAAIVSSDLPPELIPVSARLANENSVPLFYHEGAGVRPLGAPAYLYAASSRSAMTLTGDRTLSDAVCMKACIRISEMIRAEHILLFLPGGGVFHYDGRYGNVLPSLPSEPIDEEGGKDVFLSALAVEICGGKSLSDALPFAFAAKALAEAQVGFMESFPDRDEVELLLKKRTPQ